MKNEVFYYFVTAVESKNTEEKYACDSSTNCVGYFETYEEAERIVKNNVMDIFESCYDYAVIEKIGNGIYQFDQNPKWFKWDFKKKRYEACETPDFAKGIVGWAMS